MRTRKRGSEAEIKEMLRPLAERMKTDPSVTINLQGNTEFPADATGLPLESDSNGKITGSANDLMLLRAEKVKKTLIELGGGPSRITTGTGSSDSAVSTTVSVTQTK